MRTLILVLVLSFLFYTDVSAQNNYDIKLIPPALLKNANVVKRNEEVFIEIKNIGKAIITTKYALTILNEAGDDAADFAQGYSKLVSIKSLDGTLYNADGKKLKALKNADVKDISGTDEGTIADDSRVKVHNFNYKIYPYTIEYEYSLQLNGILYLPHWQPIDDENMAVEKSILKVKMPSDYLLRYKTFNYKNEPAITTEKDSKIYQWIAEKMQPILKEQFSPIMYEITTAVFLAPTNFEIQNYTGSMTDWKGFGKFIYSLNAGRDNLPDNVKQKVHQLTDKISSEKEKINILYEYLQKNSRYVSIQLGIGGWQTFDAKYVSEKGYGDCKALSNYMYSLLKEAGIKSYYTLIRAGENKNYFMDNFPSNQFNHIIVCVPQQKDTVWLECTSQTLPAGYLSGFTSNRSALLVDETGGKLIHTPVYSKNDNLQNRNIIATISNEGNLTATIHTKFTGQQQDDLHALLHALSKQKIEEYLKEIINLPSYDVVKFDYTQQNNSIPAIFETLEITGNNYAAANGKRLFIAPNIFNKTGTKMRNSNDRVYDIEIPDEFIDTDSTEFNMPKGYAAESIPDPVSIETKFGKYSTSIKINGNKIYYVRYNMRNKGHYPASDSKALKEYFDKIYKADREKIVLVKE